ncbi:AAA family ATPase [Ignatzschineria rhizosphaerae]|uniref:Chromosome partition protein Smc n=1 Tax=Ignatzschineria rhizosphaerae TaxID=2923279 RepID=A0ABY3X2Z4_9GAMM|nr:AAA family ATPase [Ignatzschineria rhizosphaerae]UNM97254.1 AAA family ATPase [Ignatzschineria rhizosphaerae]
MRLSKVKLSGFKSFVDQTTFVLTGKLNGIVGPNGCGKSNIIDAVRWVMGESSAKQLRGESMSDVIFNGSERRKPSGMASIELIFDNDEGRLGGKWAEYQEISVRRTLDRDGKSQYFLNGTRCRRRDITDIFLGTGLGPRSYAIIEQGMISRIVESKPEDLRSFFEEAANISKYKERRHETELRIEHTRTNLERLTDIRLELGKQLSRLERQAATARRYQLLKREERTLCYAELHQQKTAVEDSMQSLINSHESEHDSFQEMVENLNQVITALFDQKKAFEDLEKIVTQKNQELYPYKQAVDHLQHELVRIKALEKRDLESQAEWQENGLRLEEEFTVSSLELETLQTTFEEAAFVIESEADLIWQGEEKLTAQKVTLETVQNEYTQIRDALKAVEQKLELNRHSLQFQEEKAARVVEERARLTATTKESSFTEEESSETLLLEETMILKTSELELLTADIEAKEENHLVLKRELQALEIEQRKLSASRNQLAGEVSMLEKMVVSEEKAGKSPLFEHLKVKEGWNGAVDSILRQQLLMATEKRAGKSYILGEKPFTFTDQHLGFYIESDLALGSLLSHIYIFNDEGLDPLAIEKQASFITLREELSLHEVIVTKSGLLFGPDWAIYSTEDANFGILARQRSLENAISEIAEIDERLELLDETLYEKDEALKALQMIIETSQKNVQKLSREQFELEKKLSLLMQAKSHHEKEQHRIESRLAELIKEDAATQTLLLALKAEIETQEFALISETERFEAVEERFEVLKVAYDADKKNLDHQRNLHLEKKRHQDALERSLVQMRERKLRAESELTILRERMANQQDKTNYAKQIQEAEEAKVIAEENLIQFESGLVEIMTEFEAAKEAIRLLEAEKVKHEATLSSQKDKLNQFSIKEAELKTKRQIYLEKWEALLVEISDEEVQEAVDNHADKAIAVLEAELEEKREAIQKIGAVNLVAITEAEELRERKEYLDTENNDLEEALRMLEKAINEIDDETRTRFMETFNAVNEDFSRLFPRLFGGGKAYLKLTEDDALTSGINIIAHPPGKKPGTIHLLSGGEKALTAMALVFGIFNLNPAPFCMLDEVDAPLDEANVRRLGELIDEMSEKVQFIFITHNKATMTISDSLIGVTMGEPGVSRLVSVNLKDAMEFVDE